MFLKQWIFVMVMVVVEETSLATHASRLINSDDVTASISTIDLTHFGSDKEPLALEALPISSSEEASKSSPHITTTTISSGSSKWRRSLGSISKSSERRSLPWSLSMPTSGSYCSDQNQALTFVLPCVTSGSLQSKPSARCCSGMRSLVASLSLSCMCQILISVGGTSTASLVKNYVSTCAIRTPRNFTCKLK